MVDENSIDIQNIWAAFDQIRAVEASLHSIRGDIRTIPEFLLDQDQVQQLPAEAELLGGNGFCPNAMFVMVPVVSLVLIKNHVLHVMVKDKYVKLVTWDLHHL